MAALMPANGEEFKRDDDAACDGDSPETKQYDGIHSNLRVLFST